MGWGGLDRPQLYFALFYRVSSTNAEANTAQITWFVARFKTKDAAHYDSAQKTHRFRHGNDVTEWQMGIQLSADVAWAWSLYGRTTTVPANRNLTFRLWINVDTYSSDSTHTYYSSVTIEGGSPYFSVDRGTKLTLPPLTLGQSATLSLKKAVSNSTCSIKAQFLHPSGGSIGSYDVVKKTIATSVTWTPPIEVASYVTDSTSIPVRFYVYTYTDDTNRDHWDQYPLPQATTYMPSSVAPSVSISVTDGNGYADMFDGRFLHSKSTFKVVSTGTESYGSPIYSYLTTITGKTEMNEDVNLTLYGEEATSDIANIVGPVTIKTTVTDGRGRSGSTTVVKTAIKYEPPTITDLAVHRCDQDGTENDQGSYVSFTFSSAVQSLSNKNTAKYWYSYKSSADTAYTSQELTALANSYAVSGHTVIIPAEQNYSYVIIVRVQDKVMMTERATQASTAATVLDFKASGHGVALGKVSEEEDTFECNYKAHFYKQVKFDVPPDLPGMTVDENLTENGTNPVQGKAIYAALKNHAAQEAGSAQAGHVKLLDQAGGSYDAGAGYAATPKALDDALNAAFEVTGGGTGRGYLAPDSFLVGNGNSAVQLKTPAQVRDTIKDDTGWKTYSTSYPCVQYRKVNDIVYICAYSGAQINLTAGSYTTVGRVDASYAPSVSIYFPANTVGGGKAIDGFVGMDGYIKLYSQVSTGYWAFSVSYPI